MTSIMSISPSIANAILASAFKSKGMTGSDDLQLIIMDKQITPADITVRLN
jgi:hypothetical protein